MGEVYMPAVGAFGCVKTNGWQALGIRIVTQSPVNHSFVYVGLRNFSYKGHYYYHEPAVVEAQPSGAQYAPVSVYPQAIWSAAPPDGKGELIAHEADTLIGTGYSFVDDACIGIARLFKWDVPESVRKRLNRKTKLMCSQLVDLAYHLAGVDLYTDGRIAGDVSPGDLFLLIIKERIE